MTPASFSLIGSGSLRNAGEAVEICAGRFSLVKDLDLRLRLVLKADFFVRDRVNSDRLKQGLPLDLLPLLHSE